MWAAPPFALDESALPQAVVDVASVDGFGQST